MPDARGEVVAWRTEFSSTFVRPGGGYRTETSTVPRFARSADDTSWVPLDLTLRSAADGVRAAAGDAGAVLPLTGAGAVSVTHGGGSVSWQLRGAAAVPAQLSGSTATYAGVLPGVNVAQSATANGVKETVELSTAAAAAAAGVLTYDVTVGAGQSLRPARDGSLQVLDAAGTRVAVMPAPFMDDAAGAHSDAVTYAVTPGTGAGRYVVAMTADAAWLGASGRVFPVRIDPGGTFGAGESCTITSSAPTSSACSGTTVQVGFDGTGVRRALLRFDNLTTPSGPIPPDAQIGYSVLRPGTVSTTNGTGTELQVRGLTQTFTSGATWNTANGTTGWSGGAGGSLAAVATDAGVMPTSGYAGDQFLVTSLVTGWVTDTASNYGVALRATNEATNQTYTLGSRTHATVPPLLVVNWSSKLGTANVDTMDSYKLTDRMTLRVNRANGNGVLAVTDLSLAGPDGGLTVGRTYNTRGSDSRLDLGYGWNLSHGPDVRLQWAKDRTIDYTDATGKVWTFVNNGTPGGTDNWTSPPGLNATLEFLSPTQTRIRYNGSNNTQTFTLTGNTNALSKTEDKNANAVTAAFSTSPTNPATGGPYLSSLTDSTGRVVTFAKSTATGTTDRIGSVTDYASPTRTSTYVYSSTYNTAGQLDLVESKDPNNASTYYQYDASHQLTYITTAAGAETRLYYDTSRRVVGVCRNKSPGVLGGCTSYDYTRAVGTTGYLTEGQTWVTSPDNAVTKVLYDTHGRVTSTIDPLGHTKSASYNTNDQVRTSTTPMGAASTNTYDTLYRGTMSQAPDTVTGSNSGDGRSMAAEYEPAASGAAQYWPKYTRAEDNTWSTPIFDASGNLKSSTTGQSRSGTNQPTGGVAHTYKRQGDAISGGGTVTCGGKTGQLCSDTDGRGGVTSYAYNTYGYLTSVTPPAPLGATTMTYDAVGRVISTTDGKAQITYTDYDKLDRVVAVRLGVSTCTSMQITAGTCTTYGYDADGNLTTRVEAAGTTTFGYDQMERPTSKTAPAPSGSGTVTTSLTYNGSSLVTSYVDELSGPTYPTIYDYDAAGNLTSLQMPGGDCNATPKANCILYTYDNDDRRTKITYPSGATVDITPDTSARASAIVAKSPAPAQAVQLSRTYVFQQPNATGTGQADAPMVSKVTDEAGASTTYLYDTLQRLTSAVVRNSGGTTTATYGYGYDANGNRTSATEPGASATYAAFNAADEQCATSSSSSVTCPATPTTFTYDANGNSTAAPSAIGSGAQSFAYGFTNQTNSMTTGGTALPFAYRDTNQVERTKVGTGSTADLLTDGINGLSSRVNSTATVDKLIFNRENNGNLAALSIHTAAGWRTAFPITDNLGSIIGLTDATGALTASYTYAPYGQTLTATGTDASLNPLRYTGGYNDTATGMYKLGHRYYNPTTGRFTQPDPSGQEENTYLYAGGDPVNRTDLSGLSWRHELGNFARTLLSGIIGAAAGATVAVTVGAFTTPLIGGIVGGCVGGTTYEALDSGLKAGPGSLIASCVVGAVAGTGFSGLVGRILAVIRKVIGRSHI